MAYDRGALARVAWLTLLCACGPSVKPGSVPAEPGPVGQGQRPLKVDPTGTRVVVGEMCPQGAGGRPAVLPLVMRGVQWTDVQGEVAATVERGSVPRFVVYGPDGKQAGSFDTLGVAEIGHAQAVATGTYVGGSACSTASTTKTPEGPVASRADDPKCTAATRSCGIAIGEITRPDEPPMTASFTTGGACMSGGDLAVDIDGDGRVESFPIANVLDGVRAPAAEWTASPTATATCTPTFHVYDLRLAPEPRKGKDVEKGVVVVDVLGVIDLDADGRRELILAMRFPTVRSIVVYTSTENPQRLEKAGEGVSFAR